MHFGNYFTSLHLIIKVLTSAARSSDFSGFDGFFELAEGLADLYTDFFFFLDLEHRKESEVLHEKKLSYII